MHVIESKNVIHIISRALNCVDSRIVGHGERVAFMIYEILRCEGVHSDTEIKNAAVLGLLHDIGAYKTENIDDMVEFETNRIWEHSVYGFLFLKYLSPMKSYAEAILYHHLAYRSRHLVQLDDVNYFYAALIKIVDRVDIILQSQNCEFCLNYLKKNSGILFDPALVALFVETEERFQIMEQVLSGGYAHKFSVIMEDIVFSEEEKKQYLRMVAYSIDFRSAYMVLHTVTTVNVSLCIGQLLKLNDREMEKIYFGSLLHDIGKIGTPVEITEKPGRLTSQEMDIMKNHVKTGAEIFGDYLDTDIRNIALNHHEKMDGSGYPRGLLKADLSVSDRIVALADIVSALTRQRSYKGTYDAVKTMGILEEMMADHKICPDITPVVLDHFEEILDTSEKNGREVFAMYNGIQTEFMEILDSLPSEMTGTYQG